MGVAMSEAEAEIDVLEALDEGIDDLLAALEATEERSTYLDGQLTFFREAQAAIPEADEDERPQAVLERAAEKLDVGLDEEAQIGAPLDEHRAGVLGAWGICVGYVEGFHAGANAVIDQVDEAAAQAPEGEG